MIKREQSLTLPAVFLLIRETHRCWRNSMTSNIDRRRILSFSYSVLTWLMRWAADWNIVSEVIELWQVFVNGMMPTFWAVTFFMRWKIHEKFRVPANQRKNAFDLFTISNRKSLHNINEDWKSRYKRIGKFLCGKIYITSDADNVLIKSTIWTYHSLSFIRSFAMCGWNLLQSRVYVTNPTVLFPHITSQLEFKSYFIHSHSSCFHRSKPKRSTKSIRDSHKSIRIHFNLISNFIKNLMILRIKTFFLN